MAGGEPTRAQRSFAALIVLGLLVLFVAVVAVDFFASPNPDGGTPAEVNDPEPDQKYPPGEPP